MTLLFFSFYENWDMSGILIELPIIKFLSHLSLAITNWNNQTGQADKLRMWVHMLRSV